MPKAPEQQNTLDVIHFRSITSGDPVLEAELFRLFRATAERCIRTMEDATFQKDPVHFKTAAHELKGSAAYLGAGDLRDLCSKAEKEGMESALTGLIREETDRVYIEIHRLQSQAKQG